MEPLKNRIRTNIIYGAIALLPVAALIYILVLLFGFLKQLSEPLISYLGTDTNLYLNMALLVVFTIFTLLALCYFIGVLINTQIGTQSFKKEESLLRDIIPHCIKCPLIAKSGHSGANDCTMNVPCISSWFCLNGSIRNGRKNSLLLGQIDNFLNDIGKKVISA